MMTDPIRNFYMLVARSDGTRFHAATVRARRAGDAHAAFKPDYGFGVLALDRLAGGFFNPSAPTIEA